MGRVTVLSLADCCLLAFSQARNCPGNLRWQERGIVVRQDIAAKSLFYECLIGGYVERLWRTYCPKELWSGWFLYDSCHQFFACFSLPDTSFTQCHVEWDWKQALQCLCYLPFLLQCGPATKICWNTVALNAWLLTKRHRDQLANICSLLLIPMDLGNTSAF